MNTLPTLTTIVAIVACLYTLQANSLPIGDDPSVLEESQQGHVRVRRFSCDVLGIEIAGVKVNSAACGAHCLSMGKTGGYCDDKSVCICR